jgi:hypothetical protein
MDALYYDKGGMRIYLRNARGGVLVVQYPYLDMPMACSVIISNYPGRDGGQYVSLREFGDLVLVEQNLLKLTKFFNFVIYKINADIL